MKRSRIERHKPWPNPEKAGEYKRLKQGGSLKPRGKTYTKRRSYVSPATRKALRERCEDRCELQACPGCLGLYQAPHHVIGAAHCGPGTLDNLKGACNPCNGYVETLGAEAYRRGLKKYGVRTGLNQEGN